MHEFYFYDANHFDDKGENLYKDEHFLFLLAAWEHDFQKKFRPVMANHFFGNSRCMRLLDGCLSLAENQRCGMDLINGEPDLDENLRMGEFSEYSIVYAINSELQGHEDDALFLVLDDSLPDGKVMLKYIADDDDDDTSDAVDPVNIIQGRKLQRKIKR